MEIKFVITNTVQAFHFTDILLHNSFSFRVLSEVREVKDGDDDVFHEKVYTVFVTVPSDDAEVPF